MAIHPLLYTLATDAAGTVAGTAIGAIGQTVSFADALRSAATEQIAKPFEKTADNELSTGPSAPPSGDTPTNSDVTTYLEEIRRVAETAQRKLLAKFRQLADNANVDPNTEFALLLDASGELRSLSDNPDARQIENLAAGDPETAQLITEILDANRVLTAAEEYPSFQEAYQRDPLLAVAKYSHLFDGTEEPVLAIRPGTDELSISL